MKQSFRRAPRRRAALVAGLILVGPVLGAFRFPHASAEIATSITVDGARSGRVFDGIGAISGGGGNTRLLHDYPEPQRGQVLDYLFKPGYGANLQILKVEIGGDTNSTDGAEKSHMHSRTDLNCNRGYEWWVMQQAKARNPGIKLAALAWGAPGWVGGPSHTFWTDDTIAYLIEWLDCARSHGLTIDYVGGWNEKGYDKLWYQRFHQALARSHPNVKLVGDDGNKGWRAADDMVADPEFRAAVDVVGIHYSCGYQGTDKGKTCLDSANARSLGKPLWASETGSQDYDNGAFANARSFNRGYIDARMTGYLNWPLIAAITPNLRWNRTGLMVANEPWAGSYSVGKNTWAIAHTTQFTSPGWNYIDSATGFLGGNRGNGSYVTLKAPNGRDYSTIVETIDATEAQTVTVTVAGGLSTGAVHVWATDLNSNNTGDHFVKTADVTPTDGKYLLTLKPGYLYSITTTSGQAKGTARGLAGHAMPLPHSDNFDRYRVGSEARYLADMDGAFEIVNCGAGRGGRCVRQMAPEQPIVWRNGLRDPSALLGDVGWTDYTLSVDVMLERAGYVELQGRVGTQGGNPSLVNAYFLRVTDKGEWSIIRSKNGNPILTTLASGTVAALGTNTWHTLALEFKGSAITARIGGKTVGSVTDATYAAGQVGIATSRVIHAQFDNLSIVGGQSAPPIPAGTYKLLSTKSGHALAVVGGSAENRGLIEQAASSAATSQRWTIIAVGGGFYKLVNVGSTKVLDVPSHATTPGTQLIQYTDNGGTNQHWRIESAGGGAHLVTSRSSGLVVDVEGGSTAPGARVVQWPAGGGAHQQWQLVKVP